MSIELAEYLQRPKPKALIVVTLTKAKRAAAEAFIRSAQQFGVTPAARSRVQASKNDNIVDSKAAKYFARIG